MLGDYSLLLLNADGYAMVPRFDALP